jgi:hypothetical protein
MLVTGVIASLVIPARNGHVFLVSVSEFREDEFISRRLYDGHMLKILMTLDFVGE